MSYTGYGSTNYHRLVTLSFMCRRCQWNTHFTVEDKVLNSPRDLNFNIESVATCSLCRTNNTEAFYDVIRKHNHRINSLPDLKPSTTSSASLITTTSSTVTAMPTGVTTFGNSIVADGQNNESKKEVINKLNKKLLLV